MTLKAIVDDKDCGRVATTLGWSDFFDWADAQPYFQLAHLVYHGYATQLKTLAMEIDQAIEESNPPVGVKEVARGIEQICRANPRGKILMVTDEIEHGDSGNDDDADGE